MALSGSFKTKTGYSASNGDFITLRFDWTATQSISSNSSTVKFKVILDRQTPGKHVAVGPVKVYVDGKLFQNTNRYDSAITGFQLIEDTIVLNHTNDGKRDFNVSLSGNIYTGAGNKPNATGTQAFTLNTIPRQATITSAPNFTDEDKPSITYSNPAGNAVSVLQACITLTDDITYVAEYRSISKTGNKYTFNFTPQEISNIYKLTANSNSVEVYFYVSTNIGSNRYHSRIKKTLSIVNAKPTISPTVIDTWDKSVALTGNNQVLVRDKSNATYDFKPTFQKGATFKSCAVRNGSVVKSNALTGMIENPLESDFEFSLTDSRGNTAYLIVKKIMVPYVRPTINLNTKIEFVSENKINIILNISGQGFNGSFGTKNNTFYTRVRYGKDGEAFGEYISNPFSLSFVGQDYTATYKIENLDYKSTYAVEVSIADLLNAYVLKTANVQATPVFDWGSNYFNMNVPFNANKVNSANVNGVCMRSKYINNTSSITLKTNLLFDNTKPGHTRQTILIMGMDNGTPIFGMLHMSNKGNSSFTGNGSITATATNGTNNITINFPTIAFDIMMFISPEYFDFV